MGRVGLEPTTLGLEAGETVLRAPRGISRIPVPEWDLAASDDCWSRAVSECLVLTLFPPWHAMNAPPVLVRTTYRYRGCVGPCGLG